MLLIASSTSYSQPKTTPSPEIKRERLAKGKPAPFAGVLLSNAALAKIISDYEAKLSAAKLEAERAKRDADAKLKAEQTTCKIKLDGAAKKLAIVEGGCMRERAICDKALKDCSSKDTWFRSPYLHNVLGCAVCGGICAGAVAASRR